MMDLFQNACFAFSPDRPLFGPPGGDIDAIYGKGKHASHRVSTMGHGVSFQKAWSGFIPLVGFQGDLFLQKSAGFGSGPASFFILAANGFQQPPYSGGRDFSQVC